jgi:hypothetical protein
MSNPVLTEQQAAFILKMKQEHQPKEQTMTEETKPETPQPETKSDRRKFPIENRGINDKLRKFFAKNRQATIADAVAATGATLPTIYNLRYAIRKKNPKYFDVKKSGPKPIKKDAPQVTHSPESYLTKPIRELDLTVRAENALKLINVRTIGDLVTKRRIDLQFIRGMGTKSINEIEDALKAIGLSLKSRAVGGRAPYPSPAPVPEITESATPDMVNSPPHYKSGGVETIDFIEAKNLNYNLGNVVKYITRADLKGNRKQDLNKAMWYLQREIDSGVAK